MIIGLSVWLSVTHVLLSGPLPGALDTLGLPFYECCKFKLGLYEVIFCQQFLHTPSGSLWFGVFVLRAPTGTYSESLVTNQGFLRHYHPEVGLLLNLIDLFFASYCALITILCL